MKKEPKVVIKNQSKEHNQKELSESSLIISSKKLDQAIRTRRSNKQPVEEFTEWK